MDVPRELLADDADGAIAAARELLLDRARAQSMGRAGLDFTREHRGASARVLAMINL